MAEQPERMSRAGIARALVLLGSALLLAVTGIVCFVALVFGPVLGERYGLVGPVVLAVVVFVVIIVLAIALANLFAMRARGTRGIVLTGCGTLLAGSVIGGGALLLIMVG
ncbi:MAG TPA: hypothetical protein VGX25_19755 [Actinophytocola sp.]|uniref:hypothetical protein n=1 Tax=Actinophytocola sp. TaxID=1872138 RepID=UPI002DDD172C|nr:hypothetical protein [Actinophytocola sp.]HEV2781625.1 hypothetical protein [Actinophytocola sp.]